MPKKTSLTPDKKNIIRMEIKKILNETDLDITWEPDIFKIGKRFQKNKIFRNN